MLRALSVDDHFLTGMVRRTEKVYFISLYVSPIADDGPRFLRASASFIPHACMEERGQGFRPSSCFSTGGMGAPEGAAVSFNEDRVTLE